MPASRVSPEVRAAAMADLVAGEQPAVVAERHRLNRSTVKSWAARMPAILSASASASTLADASSDARASKRPSVEARKQRIAEIVLDLLATKLEGARQLAAHLSDPAFLADQKVDDLLRISDYLDRSALTLGDRLAGQPADADDDTEPG
jgi:hypothetical protein